MSGTGDDRGMDGEGLSVRACFEVTKKYAAAYEAALKKGKGAGSWIRWSRPTGWNRDHARQQLRARMRQPKGRASGTVAVIDRRRTRGLQVFLRCPESAPECVGGQRRAVREVSGVLDGWLARPVAKPRVP